MNVVIPAVVFIAGALAAGVPDVCGHESEQGKTHEMASPNGDLCNVVVHITEDAERQPGGALYEGPGQHQPMTDGDGNTDSSHQSHTMPSGSMTAAEDMATADGSMPAGNMQAGSDDMAGAHMDHAARNGGEFLMAGTKLHHVEVTYSKACGVRVYMYNAFTQPIGADRFQGFVLVVPEDEDRFYEAIRFLTPTEDGSCLQANLDLAGKPPHEIELYMKFPVSDEPEVFTVFLGQMGH